MISDIHLTKCIPDGSIHRNCLSVPCDFCIITFADIMIFFFPMASCFNEKISHLHEPDCMALPLFLPLRGGCEDWTTNPKILNASLSATVEVDLCCHRFRLDCKPVFGFCIEMSGNHWDVGCVGDVMVRPCSCRSVYMSDFVSVLCALES